MFSSFMFLFIFSENAVNSGIVQVRAYYSGDSNVDNILPIVNIPGIDLCSLSSSIECPLDKGSRISENEFHVCEFDSF